MTLSAIEFRVKAKRVNLIISDVDGVLTDGSVMLDAQGTEIKRFNILDGFAIRCWQRAGHSFAVLSGRASGAVEHRCQELGISRVLLGKGDKVPHYQQLLKDEGLTPDHVCFVGDDLPDLPLIIASGIGATVANGVPEVRQRADWVSPVRGGEGAIRDLIVALLEAQGIWQSFVDQYSRELGDSTSPAVGAG